METSHGKLRPSRPRLRDVPTTNAVAVRSRDRDQGGRFKSGNAGGSAKRLSTILKNAGFGEPVLVKLAGALLQELPSDAPVVRALARIWAHDVVLTGVLRGKALRLGLESDHAVRLLDLALKADSRVERLAVTCLALSERVASARYRNAPNGTVRRIREIVDEEYPGDPGPVIAGAPRAHGDGAENPAASTPAIAARGTEDEP